MIISNQTVNKFIDGAKYINCTILAPWDDYYKGEFENCSFRNTSLGVSFTPKILRGYFNNCNFTRAFMSFTKGHFKNCYFGEMRCLRRDVSTIASFTNCHVDVLLDICHKYEVIHGLEVRRYRFDKRILHAPHYRESYKVRYLKDRLNKPYEIYSDEHYVWLERCDVKLSVEEQMALDITQLPRKIEDRKIRHYVQALKFYNIVDYKQKWRWLADTILFFLFYKGKKIVVAKLPYSNTFILSFRPHADIVVSFNSPSNYLIFYGAPFGDNEVTPANDLKNAINISKNYVDKMRNVL